MHLAAAPRRARSRCRCCVTLRPAGEHAALARARSGLYQYLALEIMIWMLFALGYNLLLGYDRPAVVRPRRLLRRRRLRLRPAAAARAGANLWFDLARRGARRRGARGAVGRRLHLAPARHLLRAADHRLRPGVLVRRHQVAQRHRRRGRPAQHQAPAAAAVRLRDASTCAATRRSSISCSALFALVLVALWRLVHSPFGRVLARDPAERDARRLRRLQRVALQVAGVHDLVGGRRAGRRPVRDGAAVGLSRT